MKTRNSPNENSPQCASLNRQGRCNSRGACLCGRILRSLQYMVDARGVAILMISSELEEMTEGSDRVVALREGAVVGSLSEEEITEGNLMEMLAHGEDSGDGVRENGESADG